MIRQIVLDTETTGLSHAQGHRVIEIGCVELIDRRMSGATYHCYLNPERAVDASAFQVHGLGDEFLKDKPVFAQVYQELLDFLGNSELIIHNAAFDLGFLNAEFVRVKPNFKLESVCAVMDTLELARDKHPGLRNNLDALCKRYQIDASERDYHGALLDAQLLAEVYLAMTCGQKSLNIFEIDNGAKLQPAELQLTSCSPVIYPESQEIEAHQQFIEFLKKQSSHSIWEQYQES